MQLKPFKEIIAMSKEKLNEAMAGPRARKVQAQAEVKKAELDCRILTLETEAQELWTVKDIEFDRYFEKLDEIGLLERRRKQYDITLGQLFPNSDTVEAK